MDYVTLGRTGLSVSVAGLGSGGHSRLGRAYGRSGKDAVELIHAALDFGINFIDTAWAYGTEAVVGEALAGHRARVVLSTKSHVAHNPFSDEPLRFLTPEEMRARVDESLRKLRTDYIDVYHMHGVEPHTYAACVERAVPVLEQLRDEGKIRFLGITERFAADTEHAMLERALEDDVWDVVMVGFNLLNPSARRKVLPAAQAKRVGTLDMFAVRRALTSFEALEAALETAVARGWIDAERAEALGDPPLGLLTKECGAASLAEAAYRFCRHEPGIDVVLTGTGSVEHLRENVASLMQPPLPASCLDRLAELIGDVDSLSGD